MSALLGSTFKRGDVLTFINGMVGAITLNDRISLTNVNGCTTKPQHMPDAEAYLQLNANKVVQIDVPVHDPESRSVHDRIKFITIWCDPERQKRLGIKVVDECDYELAVAA